MTEPLPTPPPPDASFGIPPRAPPPKKPGGAKTVWIVLGVVVGFCVLVALGLGGLIYAAASREGTAAKATDRAYLVTFEDVQRQTVGIEKIEGVEKLTRDDFLGSHELSYEYEPKGEPLYLTSSLTVDTDARSARDTYNGMSLGMKLMFAAQGEEMTLEDRDDLLKWGDASRAVLMKNAGNPVGNVFLARKGNRVFFFTLAGVYFEDPEAFAELLEPKLEKMHTWQP